MAVKASHKWPALWLVLVTLVLLASGTGTTYAKLVAGVQAKRMGNEAVELKMTTDRDGKVEITIGTNKITFRLQANKELDTGLLRITGEEVLVKIFADSTLTDECRIPVKDIPTEYTCFCALLPDRLPDLIVTSLWAEQRARCSWDADVKVRVKNAGEETARGVVVTFRVDGTPLSTPPSFDLEPGREKTVSTPWTMGAGSYTLYAKVDPDNAIPESDEANNELTKDVKVEVASECARRENQCRRWERQCVREECTRRERYCCRTAPQTGQCLEWCDRCVQYQCVEWKEVCVEWESVCVQWRDCPRLLNPQPLTGRADKQPWSGWWWPLRDSANPNLYDKEGPLDKYDQYVLATRGVSPGAREWEEKNLGSALLFFTLEVERDDLNGSLILGKHGSAIEDETIRALSLLKELITGVTPQDRIEEQIKQLEETMYDGGLWWESFKGNIPSLHDLLAHAWTIKSESREEAGEAASWMGICHGLAAAAVMEEEPVQPRTLYGINFTVADLKGLLAKVWQEAQLESWKPTPKNFHEKLQEIIGVQGKPLIMDLARGRPVAHHPAYQYEIRKVKEEGATVTFEAKVWFAGYASPQFVGTTSFTKIYVYSLNLDDQWNIVDDGTWISEDRPDSLWVPIAPRPGNPRVDVEIVREIIGRVNCFEGGVEECCCCKALSQASH